MPLTVIKVENAKPERKPRKLSDGRGLYLLVLPAGGKYWRLEYRFRGEEKVLALGTFPEVSLSEARERRDDAHRQPKNGIDPGEANSRRL